MPTPWKRTIKFQQQFPLAPPSNESSLRKLSSIRLSRDVPPNSNVKVPISPGLVGGSNPSAGEPPAFKLPPVKNAATSNLPNASALRLFGSKSEPQDGVTPSWEGTENPKEVRTVTAEGTLKPKATMAPPTGDVLVKVTETVSEPSYVKSTSAVTPVPLMPKTLKLTACAAQANPNTKMAVHNTVTKDCVRYRFMFLSLTFHGPQRLKRGGDSPYPGIGSPLMELSFLSPLCQEVG